MRIRIQVLTLMRIRIQLPKIMRIRIGNPDFVGLLNDLLCTVISSLCLYFQHVPEDTIPILDNLEEIWYRVIYE
jgi:hypothetical protein